MSISTRLKSFLDESQIPYSVVTHTTAYTAQGTAATLQISGKELAKSVVLWTGEEMILAVLISFPIASWAPCHLSAPFTTCLCTSMSRWPPMRRLSSTPGLTATQFACGTTTLFTWRSPGSAHSLRRGDLNVDPLFLKADTVHTWR